MLFGWNHLGHVLYHLVPTGICFFLSPFLFLKPSCLMGSFEPMSLLYGEQ